MKIKPEVSAKINFVEFDQVLDQANKRNLTSCNKKEMYVTRLRVEQIIKKIVAAMNKESSTFSKLYSNIFGVGSAYEQTKIGKPDEFDIDIVLKLPEFLDTSLEEVEEFPGFTRIRLQNFHILKKIDPDMHREFSDFVDSQNYLLSQRMMLSFVKKTFYAARAHSFPEGFIKIVSKKYKISKVEYIEPALTLAIQGEGLSVSVDLVASLRLGRKFWPCNNRKNPCISKTDFFLAPATPNKNNIHNGRFWRPSFHEQEKQIISKCYQLKPAMRVLKRIRDHFNQTVHSYAIKTLFLWELHKDNSVLTLNSFWGSPLSYVVIYMLERYMQCLVEQNIPCFWNKNLNLLSYLSLQELEKCKNDVAMALDDIKRNPQPKVLLKYLN